MKILCPKCNTTFESDPLEKILTCPTCGAQYVNKHAVSKDDAASPNSDIVLEQVNKTPSAVEKAFVEKSDFELTFVKAVKEFFKFKQYKRVHPALAVFVGILLSPFLLAVLFLVASFYCALFFIKAAFAIADYLEEVISNSAKDQVPGVQIVIYLVGYPVFFFIKVFQACTMSYFFVCNFMFQLYGHIFSCDGFKFSAFLFGGKNDPVKHFKTPEVKQSTQVAVGVLVGIIYVIIIAIIAASCA